MNSKDNVYFVVGDPLKLKRINLKPDVIHLNLWNYSGNNLPKNIFLQDLSIKYIQSSNLSLIIMPKLASIIEVLEFFSIILENLKYFFVLNILKILLEI